MSGSQCCTHLRNEFRLKHFGFPDVHFARFAYSHWRWPLGVVLLYRFAVSSYTLAFQLYTIIMLVEMAIGSGTTLQIRCIGVHSSLSAIHHNYAGWRYLYLLISFTFFLEIISDEAVSMSLQWRWPLGVVRLYKFAMTAYTLTLELYTILYLVDIFIFVNSKFNSFSDEAIYLSLQWRWPLGVVLLYRFAVSAYTLAFQLYTIIMLGGDIDIGSGSIPAWAFLTNWTYFVLTIYLFLHFLVSFWHVIKRGRNICSVPARDHHRRIFHELQIQPSLWGSNQYEVVYGTGSDVEDDPREIVQYLGLPLMHKIVWMLYNVASSGCLLVTLIFWTMLYPKLGHLDKVGLYINFQQHAVTSIIILIEHVVSAIPIRLLHFTHTLVYGLVYVVFSLIFYELRAGHPVIYPGVLDFAHPATTALVVCIVVVILLPLVQLFLFAIYRLKLFLYNKCCNPESI